jgi:hypothetical protein
LTRQRPSQPSRQHTSVVELLRRLTRLGLVAARRQDRPGAALIIREGGVDREIMLLQRRAIIRAGRRRVE